MKRGYTDQDLADFIDTYLARKYSRQLDRFFMGTVASVTAVTGGYQVTLTRSGEVTPDGGTYHVGPAYVPLVGDVVECMWRDSASAYVLWPVTRAANPFKARAYGGAQAVPVGSTGVICQIASKDYDPNNNLSNTAYNYTAPVSGYYLIIGNATWNLSGVAVGRLHLFIYINAIQQSGSEQPDTGTNGVTNDYSTIRYVPAGQTIDVRVFHDRSTAQNLYTSVLTVHYLSS